MRAALFARALPVLSTALWTLIAAPSAAAAPVVHAGSQLTPETFDASIANGPWVIEFYSPWCGHCRHFSPMWKEFVETERTTSDVKFAQVDCAAFGDFCGQHDVKGFPTIFMYQSGVKTREFKEARTLENLEAFVARYAARVTESFNAAPASTAIEAPEETEVKQAPQTPKEALVIQPRRVNTAGEVLVLDAESIEKAVSGDIGPTFVKFYAPWCHYCKGMAGAWRELAGLMQNKINIAELDCDDAKNKQSCRQYGVKSFPTLTLFVGGQRREYLGARNVEGMRSFAEKSALSTGLQSLPEGGVEAAKNAHEVFFLYLKPGQGAYDTLVDGAATTLFGAAPVFKSDSAALDSSYLVPTESPALLVFKSAFAAPLAKRPLYEDDTKKAISEWMRDWRMPLLTQLTAGSQRDLLEDGSGQRVLLAVLPDKDRETSLSQLSTLAQEWLGRGDAAGPTRFAWAAAGPLDSWLKGTYGIKPSPHPVLALIEPTLQRYYLRDAFGSALSLEKSTQLFHALESHDLGRLKGVKHSLSRLERAALSVGRSLERLARSIIRHPLLSVLVAIISLVGCCVWMCRSLDEPHRPLAKKD